MLNEINRLKEQKNAVILAHYYQPGEIQDIADFTGDSLELARTAQNSSAEVIVFCGVDFMAESAKLLSPHKTVLIPSETATCPMANSITAEDVIRLKKEHPRAAVVTYINSSAAVKAQSDICCTSANAVKIVNSLAQDEIIFVPDRNLGSYVARFTDKKIFLFDGYCPVHDRVSIEFVKAAKAAHPHAPLAVHPECRAEIIDAADFCGSTSRIIEFASSHKSKEFIIGTEEGVINTLKRKNPDKIFYPLYDSFVCRNMKKISLADVYNSLKDEIYAVYLNEEVMSGAQASLRRMMDASK